MVLGFATSVWLQLVVAGIAAGAIYSLAGMGVVLTYRATGVFNFAYGAIAVLVAYVVWQLNAQWHVPLGIAAPLGVIVVGPGLGLLIERFVFRPLERRGASQAERLVAILAVFLLLLGLMYAVWTGLVRQNAPDIVSNRALNLGAGIRIGEDQLTVVFLVAAISVLVWLMFGRTRLGLEIRAVVDRRELSELAAINSNRVSAMAWAIGCGFAGLTGVLLAPLFYLDPFHLTLLVIFETFSVAVVARLVSMPAAAVTGIALGVASSLLTHFNPRVVPVAHWHLPTWITYVVGQIEQNLSAVLLLVALVVLRHLDESESATTVARAVTRVGLVASGLGGRARAARRPILIGAAAAVGALVLPWLLTVGTIGYGQVMLALIVVFTSIVCITGFCGYITLGQAGFAGIGAFVAAEAASAAHVPVILAMLLAGLAAMVLGVLTGFPVLNRRGLLLGLMTLSMSLLVYSLVFTDDLVVGGGSIALSRPSLFGWSFDGDHAFYYFELVWVAVMLLLARNLRRGRLGRILAAMRDSETAARAVGVDLRRYKLFIFAVSAFIAGIGGAMIAEQTRLFNGLYFDPLQTSLTWFVVVVVAGVGSLGGAVVGAVLYEMLQAALHKFGVSDILFAVLALLLYSGVIPGRSLTGLARRVAEIGAVPKTALRALARAQRAQSRRPTAPGTAAAASGVPQPQPSEFARRLMAGAPRRERVGAGRGGGG
ncbi:MAG TPA: ABC transporter permease [Acidimicrobiales bacterium]|nr:ABC transporter permease [Acidimicrobiales bacterium]